MKPSAVSSDLRRKTMIMCEDELFAEKIPRTIELQLFVFYLAAILEGSHRLSLLPVFVWLSSKGFELPRNSKFL
ncbi:hypothetical protein Y032_0052g2188 [Ancylostoma ceylanicum]|uniref:Uncharacterized protein n=1 Tax=Ancylostoma ceylanicum TaxID=53326 RepID=A0A016U8Z7_9BILA|nr:hypothetical protein Y032_0052g2188 [Ancylostoma ceylanicum]